MTAPGWVDLDRMTQDLADWIDALLPASVTVYPFAAPEAAQLPGPTVVVSPGPGLRHGPPLTGLKQARARFTLTCIAWDEVEGAWISVPAQALALRAQVAKLVAGTDAGGAYLRPMELGEDVVVLQREALGGDPLAHEGVLWSAAEDYELEVACS